MRQKKTSRRRTEVRVFAEKLLEGYRVNVHDQNGYLLHFFCTARQNVAFKATQEAATALKVPEGRIKINRVEYV